MVQFDGILPVISLTIRNGFTEKSSAGVSTKGPLSRAFGKNPANKIGSAQPEVVSRTPVTGF
jgi:hypothetical protein